MLGMAATNGFVSCRWSAVGWDNHNSNANMMTISKTTTHFVYVTRSLKLTPSSFWQL
ncbi:unnamed protein product [Ceratitis capitata]|uniref:(Mediterranean fruit fly) hypothetical protein n=1 Tax=Ceratitis capitata TaxID=7213 RepID=A0A811V4D8_CERCA|nr:unnamed protein product [Ceratitis capitata]